MNDLVRRLIAANEGDKVAASGNIFYDAAERISNLEHQIEDLQDKIDDLSKHIVLYKLTVDD